MTPCSDPGEQRAAPFFEALVAYVRDGVVPFHTPGHKQGKGAPPAWRRALGEMALALDVSDVLRAPAYEDSWPACLKAAEELAARLFGAEFTHFLVNGSSGGIQAMVWATCNPGQRVAVSRQSHRSVLAALLLAGAEPVYVPSRYDPDLDLWLPPPPAAWRASWEREGARALLLTRPTYEGLCLPLDELAAQAHAHGLAVLVDEAHGAHLGFGPGLPPGGLACGADLVVQSTHKLLAALTQAAMLHGRGPRVCPARVRAALGLLQSTSPSALLLASLDVARRQLAVGGEARLRKVVALAAHTRERIGRIPGLSCLAPADAARRGLALDPLKLVISFRGLGLPGPVACRWLRRKAGVQLEMETLENGVAVVTLGDDERTTGRLVAALGSLAAEARRGGVPVPPAMATGLRRAAAAAALPVPRRVLPPHEAVRAPARLVPLRAAAGAVSAELICPYPPGVPVVCPGEEIGAEVGEYLEGLLAAGLSVQGLMPGEEPQVRVVGEVTRDGPAA